MAKSAAVLLFAAAVVSEAHVLMHNPGARGSRQHSVLKKGLTQSLDNFWTHHNTETYDNHAGRFFRPSVSSTFSLIKLNNVNVTFLDNTNLRGYDAADIATLGHYKVMTRMGMIEHCNSRNFDDVDGILGFGWADQPRSAALLKTLTQRDRPGWNIHDQIFQGDGKPMPRKFAFTADDNIGELQLGGVDDSIAAEPFVMFPMSGENVYGIKITSITYGGVELLHFQSGIDGFTGEFDSGTTCLLLPNTDVKGNFTTSPFGILAREQLSGKRHPLLYTATDIHGVEHTYSLGYNECVEPTDETMILGDPWFRKWVVLHDLEDLSQKQMGLALRSPSYALGASTDRSILTPDHAPNLLTSMPRARGGAVARVPAARRVRGGAFAQALAETKRGLARASELAALGGSGVDKVAVRSQSRVTYNIQLSIGSPAQPMAVIFDTGSFMLAVFAEAPPAGMTPLLKDDPKPAAKAAAAVRRAAPAADAFAEGTEELAQVSAVASWAPAAEDASADGQMWALAGCSGVVLVALLALVTRRRRCASEAAMAAAPVAAEAHGRIYGSC